MPRTYVELTRGRARALVAQLATDRGHPRCHCPAHGGAPVAGLSPPCPCTSATGAGVSPACPHATHRHVAAVRHPSDPARWLVPVDATVHARLTPAERAAVGPPPAAWRQARGQSPPDDEP